MTSIERILQICKERGIAVSKLERECGFANAYFRGLKGDKIPADRLQKIADYLSLSTVYLLTGEEKEDYYTNPETAEIAQEIYEDPELRLLFDASRGLSPENIKLVRDLVIKLKQGQ